MKIIGLTGGIGSGKSTVASILKELGAIIIDSDKVGHEVLNPSTPGWYEVIETFGQDILTQQGSIDRQKLAQIVFNDTEALNKLNQIVHPKVEHEVQSRLKKFQEQGLDVVVIEAALIGEAIWPSQAEQIWVVKTPREITLRRLKKRGLSESESLARMASQYPAEERVKHGLVIITNEGTKKDLKTKVTDLWVDLHNKNRKPGRKFKVPN
jgi:dephospho-CoA kinase